MSTFSDLNLNVTNLQEKQIDQLVEHAIKLGYDNLALAVDYEFPSSTSQNKPEQQGNKKNKKDGSNKPVINIPLAKSYKLPQALQDRLNSCSRKIKIYSRITVKIKPGDINTCLHHLKSKPVLSYDLIALEPLDNQVLLYLCTNNFNADIISINSGISCGLTDKHLMRPLKNALTSFSMRFELNYSPSITSSTERRDFIMAGRCLTFNTNSNGLFISSGCSQKIGLRGPYEILNIVKLFDIKDLSAHQIVRRTPHDIITNSFCRKHTSAGMVYFNDISDLKRLEKALLSLKEKCDEAATKSSTNSQCEDKQQHDQNISNKRLKKE